MYIMHKYLLKGSTWKPEFLSSACNKRPPKDLESKKVKSEETKKEIDKTKMANV